MIPTENMIATLAESGSSYSLGNQRSYDAWGGIRSGSTTGGPSPRHCANLGHVQDDESGLVYMRARYYDAGSGRFVSEDSAEQGANWFVYVDNHPEDAVDITGKGLEWLAVILSALICAVVGEATSWGVDIGTKGHADPQDIFTGLVAGFLFGLGLGVFTLLLPEVCGVLACMVSAECLGQMLCFAYAAAVLGTGWGLMTGTAAGAVSQVVFACMARNLQIEALLASMDDD